MVKIRNTESFGRNKTDTYDITDTPTNMFGLCAYKNMFGLPGKGVHSTRFLGVAVVDVLMTVIGAVLLAYLMKWNVGYTILGMFVAGIVLHRAFCVRTTVDRFLFPDAT